MQTPFRSRFRDAIPSDAEDSAPLTPIRRREKCHFLRVEPVSATAMATIIIGLAMAFILATHVPVDALIAAM